MIVFRTVCWLEEKEILDAELNRGADGMDHSRERPALTAALGGQGQVLHSPNTVVDGEKKRHSEKRKGKGSTKKTHTIKQEIGAPAI